MAMQVGVPIVPVVIHNSVYIAPKCDFLFRPGKVRIDVLAPVDTSEWSAAKMDEQVNSVRNMFLRALGQPEQTIEEVKTTQSRQPDDMRPELKNPDHKNPGQKKAPRTSKKKAAAKVGTKTTLKPKVKANAKTTAKTTTQPKTRVTSKTKTPAKAKAAAKSKAKKTNATTKIKTPGRKIAPQKRAAVRPKLAAKD